MSTNVSFGQNSRFKIGWIILLIIAALMTLGHFSLIFIFMDERVLFAGLASSNLYAFLVIYLLFRRGEKWAWVVTWILPALALLIAVTRPQPSNLLLWGRCRMRVGIASYDAGLLFASQIME